MDDIDGYDRNAKIAWKSAISAALYLIAFMVIFFLGINIDKWVI